MKDSGKLWISLPNRRFASKVHHMLEKGIFMHGSSNICSVRHTIGPKGGSVEAIGKLLAYPLSHQWPNCA